MWQYIYKYSVKMSVNWIFVTDSESMRKTNLVIVFLCCWTGVSAQVRKYSNEFLNIGVGAAALSQANAVVASSNDVYSGYWNPAGLNHIGEGNQFALQHAEYFASIAKYDYFGFARRIDPTSAIGISMIRFGVDDILDTSELIDSQGNVSYDRIQKFNAADYALFISFAKSDLVPGIDLGASAKLIYRNIGSFASSVGFGFDVGAQWNKNGWNAGLMARDITSTFNGWQVNTEKLEAVFDSTGNEAPTEGLELTLPSLVLGLGKTFDLSENITLKGEANIRTYFDGQRNELLRMGGISFDPGLGLELGYKSWAFLRLGCGNFQSYEIGNTKQQSFQPNLGVGLCYKNFWLDYALTDIGDQSVALYSNVFSLKYVMQQ